MLRITIQALKIYNMIVPNSVKDCCTTQLAHINKTTPDCTCKLFTSKEKRKRKKNRLFQLQFNFRSDYYSVVVDLLLPVMPIRTKSFPRFYC